MIYVANANAVPDDMYDVYMMPDSRVAAPRWSFLGRSTEDHVYNCKGGVFVPPSFGATSCLPQTIYGFSGHSRQDCEGLPMRMEFCNAAAPALLESRLAAPCVRIVTAQSLGYGNWVALFVFQVINSTVDLDRPLAYTEIATGEEEQVDTTLCWGAGAASAAVRTVLLATPTMGSHTPIPTPSGSLTATRAGGASASKTATPSAKPSMSCSAGPRSPSVTPLPSRSRSPASTRTRSNTRTSTPTPPRTPSFTPNPTNYNFRTGCGYGGPCHKSPSRTINPNLPPRSRKAKLRA